MLLRMFLKQKNGIEKKEKILKEEEKIVRKSIFHIQNTDGSSDLLIKKESSIKEIKNETMKLEDRNKTTEIQNESKELKKIEKTPEENSIDKANGLNENEKKCFCRDFGVL